MADREYGNTNACIRIAHAGVSFDADFHHYSVMAYVIGSNSTYVAMVLIVYGRVYSTILQL